MALSRLPLVLSLFLCTLFVCNSQNIVLKKNGYEGILVAISDSVPYDASIVPRIKKVFNDASAVLFNATESRAYFDKVTILIPKTWTKEQAVEATTETFDKANIRVDQPSSAYGDNPWVKQTGSCGVPGDFMHLTPNFLLNIALSLRRWGPAGKVVAHEWGHLRWGLYDEYPIGQNGGHFYYSATTNGIQATRCNDNVRGRNRNRRSGADCKVNPKTSLPENDCRFYPDTAQTQSVSSLMYYHYMPTVSKYCDDNDLSPLSLHNYEAPNQQNRLCGGKSSWAVMRQSPDFANGANGAVDDDRNFDTNVTFTVVRPKEAQSVVIVMDISGSMETDNNYIKLVTAVRRFLLYTLPKGSKVGLVEYSSSAQMLTPKLEEIKDDASRRTLSGKVIPKKTGKTAIGQGLLRAKQLLQKGGNSLKGTRIILLTDGQENVQPWVRDVKPQLLTDGIVIDTILLTKSASQVLISLAADTGGLSFYSSGSDSSTSLLDAYTTAERKRLSDPRLIPLTIQSRVVDAAPNNDTCFNVPIDDGLGRDSTFTFSWVNNKAITVKVTSPDNTTTTATEDFGGNSAGYKCPGQCETGIWTVCIKNVGGKSVKVVSQIESTPRESNSSTAAANQAPIVVTTKIVNKEPNFKSKDRKPVSIYASVTRGYAPVVNAKVIATIESPTAKFQPIVMELRDDGVAADMNKDDGVYSVAILNAKVTGKHSISVNVNGDDQANVKSVKFNGAASITEPGDPISEEEVVLSPTGNFERYSPADFIDVKSVAPQDTDLYPPAKVIDFEVVEVSYERGEAILEWTAVGDDYDVGNASYYELWTAPSHKVFYRSFGNASQLNESEVVDGSLQQPQPPFSRERITLRLSDLSRPMVLALRVGDDGDNLSELSNIISVKAVKPAEEDTGASNTALIIGVSVGGAVLLIVIIAVAVICVRRNSGVGKIV